MKITINGQQYDAYQYDDDMTILERYSLSKEGSVPSFFRIENKDFVIEEGAELQVSDVRDLIKNLSAEDLEDNPQIESILSSYPKLKKRDIGVLWIIENYEIDGDKIKEEINVTFLKTLDRITFLTSAKAASITVDFLKKIKRERDVIASRSKKGKKIFDVLNKYQEMPSTGPFVLEEITTQSILKLPNGENLLDVFDAMDTSKNIPFIILARKKKIYYKVFRHIIPPIGWVDFVPPFEGIFFKVLNMPASKLSSRQIMLENLYSNGIWTVDNKIELDFKVREGTPEEVITGRFFDALGDRLEYEVVSTHQTGIKGIFTIPSVSFNRVIFADLVATNEYFRYFLFFNEKNKTILAKPRFYVYYASDQQGIIPNSLALTITPQLTDGQQSVTVRVSHAMNFQQANAARIITSKLFSLYLEEYEQISDIYASLTKDVGVEVKKKEKKEDKKTGPRAAALRKVNPGMFGSRYPDQCQKQAQPYILKDKEEALAKAEELGDPHKVMFYEGTWYACEPREPYLDPSGNKDKDNKHVFPGLKENKPKTGDPEYNKEYKKKYPDIVCCFTQDQYEKGASRLRKYREGLTTGERPEDTGREIGIGHIVGANKRLQAGRFGELPFNWERLLDHMGINKITRGKQTFHPILRHGVVPSADSVIHCLERAFNPRYASLITSEKKDVVSQVRETLSESNLSIGRQELYDYTETDIQQMLLDEDQYLAPEMFVSLLQQYYDCNIFIYLLDDKHPNGDIVIPRSSQAYLTRDINELKRTVFIIKYETETDDYPYQCEVFCQLAGDGKIKGAGLNFVFENSPIVKIAVELFYDANEVFVVSTDGYEPYHPVPEITS